MDEMENTGADTPVAVMYWLMIKHERLYQQANSH